MFRTLTIALALTLTTIPSALAQAILPPAQFREAAIAMIRAEHPEITIEVRDELGLTLRAADGNESFINLDSGYAEYRANPEALSDILARWARISRGPPTDARHITRIVSVLRPMQTIEAYAAGMPETGQPIALVWRPFAGDIAEVLAFDSAEALEYVTEQALTDLGVTAQQAWGAAPVNLPNRLGALEVGSVEGAAHVAFVTGGNGLTPSVLIGRSLCDSGVEQYFLVIDRNAFISVEKDDEVGVLQLCALMDEIRRSGGLYSNTPLTCRNGAMAAVTFTD